MMNLFSQSHFTNEKDKQVLSMLRMLIYASLFAFSIVFLFGLYFDDRNMLIITVISCLSLIVILYLLRSRRLLLSSWLFSLSVLASLTLLSTFGQGYRDISVFAFPIILIFTSMTMNRLFLLINSGLIIVSIGWLVLGEMNRWYAPLPTQATYLADFLMMSVLLMIMVYAVDRLSANMRNNLEQANNEIEQRRKIENELKESESQYRSLFENDHTVMLIIEPDTSAIIDANPAASAFYGWSHEELLKMKINVINTLSKEELHSEMQLAREEKRNHFFFQHRCADKTVKDVEVYSGPLIIAGKTVLYSIIHDITERKRAQDELLKAKEKAEKNEQLYSMLINSIPDTSILLFDKDLRYLIVGGGEIEKSGFDKSLIQGRTLSEAYPKDVVDLFEPLLRKAFSGEATVFEMQYAQFTYLQQIIPIRDNSGNIFATMQIASNISERKQIEEELLLHRDHLEQLVSDRTMKLEQEIAERKNAEASLRESEAKYRNIVDNSSSIILEWDSNGTVLFLNQYGLNLFGFKKEEIIGHNVMGTIVATVDSTGYDLQSRIQNIQEHPDDYHSSENENICKNGDKVWIAWTNKGIRTEDGRLLKTISIGIDRTKLKQLEDELKQMTDLAAMNQRLKQEILDRKIADKALTQSKEEIILHNERLESLLKISQYRTDSIQELLDFALNEAIKLTESKIGYIYFYNETTQQFILNSWSKDVMKQCNVMNPQTVYDLDKTGCWGEAVRQRKPIVLNDYQAENPLKRGTPEGHVTLEKFLTIPVIFENKIVAVAGVANKTSDYNNSDIRQLTLLMDSVWKISERIMLIDTLKIAKEKAEESESRLVAAQTVTKVGSWETDLLTMKVIWSDETYRIFGTFPCSFKASHQGFLEFVHPEDKEIVDLAFKKSFYTKGINTIEHRIIAADNSIKFVEERWEIQSNSQNIPYKAVGTCQNITERKQIENELMIAKQKAEESEENTKKSLREKETLLRELYHRTKNTLQVVRGMIALKSFEYPNNLEMQQLVKNTEDRIQAISLVHQMLYQSQDLSQISIKQYMQELSHLIFKSYGISNDRIVCSIATDDKYYLLDTAIPLGLILNELFTNSLKFAFPNNQKGIISITLNEDEFGNNILQYSDDGVGVPDGFDFKNQNTLGLKLVHSIGEEQMLGKVFMENKNGIAYTLEFPNTLYEARV